VLASAKEKFCIHIINTPFKDCHLNKTNENQKIVIKISDTHFTAAILICWYLLPGLAGTRLLPGRAGVLQKLERASTNMSSHSVWRLLHQVCLAALSPLT
jgi:hypothetical protein